MTVKSIELPINSNQTNLFDLLADFDISYGVVFYNPSGQIPSFIDQGMCETVNGQNLWVQIYSISAFDQPKMLDHFKFIFIPRSENHAIELLNTDIQKTFAEKLNPQVSNEQNCLTLIVFD